MIATLTVSFLAALAKSAFSSIADEVGAAITNWYVQRQTTETLGLIAEAADLAANAKTDADRLSASKAWYVALNRLKYTP